MRETREEAARGDTNASNEARVGVVPKDWDEDFRLTSLDPFGAQVAAFCRKLKPHLL